MTGREIIIYILEHKLEDVDMSNLLAKGEIKLPGFMSVDELAVKLGLGPETVKVMYELNLLSGYKIGDTIYINYTEGVKNNE